MRWLEFLKDYDINFRYHLGKGNAAADALSHRSYPTLNSLLELAKELCEAFKKLEINVVMREIRPIHYTMEV